MRLDDAKYRCASCDEPLDVPLNAGVRVMIRATSGRPNIRVLSLDGREIHRCEIVRSSDAADREPVRGGQEQAPRPARPASNAACSACAPPTTGSGAHSSPA